MTTKKSSAKNKSKESYRKPTPLLDAIFPEPVIDPKTLRKTKGASISLLSPDMRILWSNRYLETIHGPLPDFVGKHCHYIYHKTDKICKDCVPIKAIKTRSIKTGIIQRKTKYGSPRYLQSVAVPFLDPEGKPRSVLEILFDVTESKLLEEHLKKSEEFYRTLFQHSGTAIVVNDSKGMISSVNKTFSDLAGFKKEELEGKKHYLGFVKDKKRVAAIHEKRWKQKNNVPTRYEFIFMRKNGEERLIDININVIPGTEYSIASMIDITEKKKLETEIRAKEQFLANILKESADGIIVLDNKRIIQTWNKGAEQIFGYKASQIVGKNFELLVPPDLIEKRELEKLRKKVLDEGAIRNHVTERIRKDKRRVSIAETATLIKDTNGKIIGRAIILRDITENIRLSQEINQNEKMSAIGTLSASLAHEIKNPLNSIVINMEILKGQIRKNYTDSSGTPFDKYLNIIQGEVSRLDKVIKDFLDFAKPQSMQYKELSINQIIDNIIEFIEPETAKAGVKVFSNLSEKLFKIHGEENQLKQILLNLFLNSVQAMLDGGKLTVKTRNQPDGIVMVTISDTGIGIKNEHHNEIFSPFFTTRKQGSGLGLAMVNQLVKNHGGKITFKSKKNKGTTFYITFPAA